MAGGCGLCAGRNSVIPSDGCVVGSGRGLVGLDRCGGRQITVLGMGMAYPLLCEILCKPSSVSGGAGN